MDLFNVLLALYMRLEYVKRFIIPIPSSDIKNYNYHLFTNIAFLCPGHCVNYLQHRMRWALFLVPFDKIKKKDKA